MEGGKRLTEKTSKIYFRIFLNQKFEGVNLKKALNINQSKLNKLKFI